MWFQNLIRKFVKKEPAKKPELKPPPPVVVNPSEPAGDLHTRGKRYRLANVPKKPFLMQLLQRLRCEVCDEQLRPNNSKQRLRFCGGCRRFRHNRAAKKRVA